MLKFKNTLTQIAQQGPHVMNAAFSEIANKQAQICRSRLPSSWSWPNSILGRLSGTGLGKIARIGSPFVGARIQHYGGVIRPNQNPGPDLVRRRVFGNKPIKYLTIPLTMLGVPKYARARDYKNIFVLKAHSGKLYLAQKLDVAITDSNKRGYKLGFAGRNGKGFKSGHKSDRKAGFRCLFELVKSVTIHPHPWAYWSAADIALHQDTLKRYAEGILK
jgi:hypothetical protein